MTRRAAGRRAPGGTSHPNATVAEDALDERTTGDTHRGNLGLLTIRGEHGVDEVLNNNNRRNNRSRDIYVNEQRNVIA